jgi:hypothetical protein
MRPRWRGELEEEASNRGIILAVVKLLQQFPRPLVETLPSMKIRLSPDFRDKIDGWRRKQDDLPSRSEAIRRLVEQALERRS